MTVTATWGAHRLATDRQSSTSLEYALIGSVLAVAFGFAFLRVGPHIAEALAATMRSIKG